MELFSEFRQGKCSFSHHLSHAWRVGCTSHEPGLAGFDGLLQENVRRKQGGVKVSNETLGTERVLPLIEAQVGMMSITSRTYSASI
jgi:hypothetical protein